MINKLLPLLVTTLLGGCTGLPENIRPVSGLDTERYLGTWYEIARLDHSFERGLERVTANYVKRQDGGIRVINRGYKPDKGEWSEAEGRAYSMGDPTIGHLKVSFFRPFYASYVIFDLDADYQTAYVCGNSRDYLWLLSRTPQLTAEQKEQFIAKAREKGFDVDSLIWVVQPKQ